MQNFGRRNFRGGGSVRQRKSKDHLKTYFSLHTSFVLTISHLLSYTHRIWYFYVSKNTAMSRSSDDHVIVDLSVTQPITKIRSTMKRTLARPPPPPQQKQLERISVLRTSNHCPQANSVPQQEQNLNTRFILLIRK